MMLNGTEKSALLLMSIGSDQAGEVLKNLTPFEVQELINSMLNMNPVSTETLNQILYDCYDIVIKNNTINSDFNDKYLSNMLSRALGEKNGNSLLQETLEIVNAKKLIESLNYMQSEQLALLLKDEHPQIITTILVYLDKNQSAAVLSYFNEDKRAEIILRITKFHGIDESCLIEINKVVKNLLRNKKLILSEKGGVKSAVSILNLMKMKEEKDTLNKISVFDKNTANHLLKELFLFKNIIDVDDKYIKIVIQNIEMEKLYVALQKTDITIREKFFKNMSDVESSTLSSSLEKKSYISDLAIQNEQKLILIMIKSIGETGSISLQHLREYYV